MRPDFARARAAAVALRLKQRPCGLRLDVVRLRYDRRILFDSMQHYCSVTSDAILAKLSAGSDCLRDGCTIIRWRDGVPHYVVLYNTASPAAGRRSFTLAHEVGHIYLDHAEDTDCQEQEANCFAAQLLAPDILVRALARRTRGALTAGEVCDVFGLSRQAAGNRIAALLHTPQPRFSPQEEELLARWGHLLPETGQPLVSV